MRQAWDITSTMQRKKRTLFSLSCDWFDLMGCLHLLCFDTQMKTTLFLNRNVFSFLCIFTFTLLAISVCHSSDSLLLCMTKQQQKKTKRHVTKICGHWSEIWSFPVEKSKLCFFCYATFFSTLNLTGETSTFVNFIPRYLHMNFETVYLVQLG